MKLIQRKSWLYAQGLVFLRHVKELERKWHGNWRQWWDICGTRWESRSTDNITIYKRKLTRIQGENNYCNAEDLFDTLQALFKEKIDVADVVLHGTCPMYYPKNVFRWLLAKFFAADRLSIWVCKPKTGHREPDQLFSVKDHKTLKKGHRTR